MSDTFEKDFFLNPDAALDEGFEIKKNMYKVQDLFDRAAEIEGKLIVLSETIPAEVRCGELIESCEASIRDIEKSDFAEYGERIERNIRTLEMESNQSVNKLKESLASCNDKLDQVISISKELSSEIQYEKYSKTAMLAGNSNLTTTVNTLNVSESELDKEERAVDVKFSEVDEMNAYLNFLMQGRHESASYFALREKYKKQIEEAMANGDPADFSLLDGTHVTFYPMPTSFRETVYIQRYQSKKKPQKVVDDDELESDGKPKQKTVNASYSEVYAVMLPYTHLGNADKYQFIDVTKQNNISVEKIREMLPSTYGLDENAKDFYAAAQDSELSAVYLVGHSRLETGEGENISHIGDDGEKYFDYYGYGAYDDSPTQGMLEESQNHGWLTKEDAIIGGAKLIKNNYVDERGQKTSRDMRYNPNNDLQYQYSTDIDWATKLVRKQEIIDYYNSVDPRSLYYRIPYYFE